VAAVKLKLNTWITAAILLLLAVANELKDHLSHSPDALYDPAVLTRNLILVTILLATVLLIPRLPKFKRAPLFALTTTCLLTNLFSQYLTAEWVKNGPHLEIKHLFDILTIGGGSFVTVPFLSRHLSISSGQNSKRHCHVQKIPAPDQS
jgi:hypothetical protein